jgi:hypothetical protein
MYFPKILKPQSSVIGHEIQKMVIKIEKKLPHFPHLSKHHNLDNFFKSIVYYQINLIR